MKKNLIPMIAALALFGFVACNNGANETTSADSSSTTTTTTEGASTMSMDTSATAGATAGSSTSTFNENTSYVDLKSGKKVKLKKDASTGYVTNQEDNSTVLFYYDPATNDTFNREGMVVNNYLIKSNAGDYQLDEKRWKTKVDEDGDFKAKDGEGTKVKVDGNETEAKIKSGDTKEKMDENSYKSKSPDGKVKEKDGKTKTKSN